MHHTKSFQNELQHKVSSSRRHLHWHQLDLIGIQNIPWCVPSKDQPHGQATWRIIQYIDTSKVHHLEKAEAFTKSLEETLPKDTPAGEIQNRCNRLNDTIHKAAFETLGKKHGRHKANSKVLTAVIEKKSIQHCWNINCTHHSQDYRH